MKRIIFLMVLSALLLSCDWQEVPQQQIEQTINISFITDDEYGTRGYFDCEKTPETWEMELHSMEIIVFQGNILYLRRTLTSEELSAKRVTLPIPSLNHSDWETYPVMLFCFANYIVPEDVRTTLTLVGLIDDLPVHYNSSGDASTPGTKWESGFTMFGKRMISSKAAEDRDITLTLQRTVAKIAVKVSVDQSFSADHDGGILEVTGASVIRAAADGWIFIPATTELPSAMNFNHRISAVKAEADKEFVFYLFPNERLISNDPSNPAILVHGVFDRDGNLATTDDRSEVQYEVFINRTNRGVIQRNYVYKYALNVVGLNGAQMESTYSVANWFPTVTEGLESGN